MKLFYHLPFPIDTFFFTPNVIQHVMKDKIVMAKWSQMHFEGKHE